MPLPNKDLGLCRENTGFRAISFVSNEWRNVRLQIHVVGNVIYPPEAVAFYNPSLELRDLIWWIRLGHISKSPHNKPPIRDLGIDRLRSIRVGWKFILGRRILAAICILRCRTVETR